MPVSHLALNVSNIQHSTSFYLAALQPLGYRYIGHQGNSIGFGEKDADFFLCQSLSGRPSPTHIAFSATSTQQVRECYAAALNAGGLPSGAPSHRNNDCGCFNAAVEDLDGNTIEFILREPCEAEHQQVAPAPSEHSRVLNWQEDVARSGADETQSIASGISKAKSRAQTALDLASTTSKSIRNSQAPADGTTRTWTEPTGVASGNGSKAFVGTLMGAAAAAAFVYAMCQSERENAREEAAFDASQRSRSRPLERSMSASGGRSRSNYEGKSTVSKKSHRNFSTTESMRSSRYPPRSMPRNMQRLLQPTPYNDDDTEVRDAISRYTQSRRPAPSRSKTYDALDYQPAKSHVSARSNGHDLKRSSTLPVVQPYMIEAPPKTGPASRHTSRRGSVEEDRLKRHDSVVSAQSRHSESRRSSTGKANTAKPSHRERDSYKDSASKVSTSKYSSHRDRNRERDSSSRASTAKPLKRSSTYDSAAGVPLPGSRANSYYSAVDKAPSNYYSTADKPASAYLSATQVPAPSSRASGSRYTAALEAPPIPNMISDLETVVPDDSISCIDLSPKRKEKSSSGSRHGSSSKRSEASTVKPAKKSGGSRHSGQTVPARSRDEVYEKRGKRSLMSFA